MRNYKYIVISLISIIILCYSAFNLYSKEKSYIKIEPDKISRYKEDRIAFQRIEKQPDISKDNSFENLLVIKDSKIYFITDGYDSPAEVIMKRDVMDAEYRYVENNDFWLNKINGKPDFVRVIYRRSDLLKNTTEEFTTTNFGTFYKSVRDKFINLHADKFRHLLKNRGEAKLTINKYLISYSVNPENSNDVKQKFFTSATAKAADETVYYCEDADGDGITETFSASRDDGFDWGINSGPNILLIYGNTDKDIETMIGKLTYESLNGTVDEEKKMFQEFPTEKEVINLMEQITPMDKFYE